MRDDIMAVKKEIQELKEQSLAMELLQDYKNALNIVNKANKRMFITILVILTMWFATIGYLVYTLNDVGSYEETITQENEDGYNNYIGNDGDINNGKAND